MCMWVGMESILETNFFVATFCKAYVQCTSPIRRYHDLYNHFRLKAALHGASMGPEWAEAAKEEAGVTLLDSMSTGEERLRTLEAIRKMTRQREQYWLQVNIFALHADHCVYHLYSSLHQIVILLKSDLY